MFTRCLSICSLVPLPGLRSRRIVRVITVTRSPSVYIAANRGAERANDRGEKRKKVFMVLALFVLKQFFAKRQNINIISLSLGFGL